jgi:hypothetical protein
LPSFALFIRPFGLNLLGLDSDAERVKERTEPIVSLSRRPCATQFR